MCSTPSRRGEKGDRASLRHERRKVPHTRRSGQGVRSDERENPSNRGKGNQKASSPEPQQKTERLFKLSRCKIRKRPRPHRSGAKTFYPILFVFILSCFFFFNLELCAVFKLFFALFRSCVSYFTENCANNDKYYDKDNDDKQPAQPAVGHVDGKVFESVSEVPKPSPKAFTRRSENESSGAGRC